MVRPGDQRYAYVLLAVAGAILTVGLVLKPVQTEGKSVPSETELAQLQRLTQQRRLRDLSDYLTSAAERVSPSIVMIRPGARSGVVWNSPRLIVTAKPGAEIANQPLTTATPDGHPVGLQRASLSSALPFATFATSDSIPAPSVRVAAAPPDAGAWVLAVAKNADGAMIYAHGVYQGTSEAHCGPFAYRSVQSSAPLTAALTGGGLFTLEGYFLGTIAHCDHEPIVIAAATIEDVLRKRPSNSQRIEEAYGIRVAEPATGENSSADASGVDVGAVWAQSRGERAGIKPGDLITALDDSPVHSAADLALLAEHSNADHKVTIQRGRRTVTLPLPVESPPEAAAATPQGLTLGERTVDGRVALIAVAPGSSAARAGLLRGDILLRIGTAAVTQPSAAARALTEAKARRITLTVERDGRKFEVLVSS